MDGSVLQGDGQSPSPPLTVTVLGSGLLQSLPMKLTFDVTQFHRFGQPSSIVNHRQCIFGVRNIIIIFLTSSDKNLVTLGATRLLFRKLIHFVNKYMLIPLERNVFSH